MITSRVPHYQRTADDCGVACVEHVAHLHRVILCSDEMEGLRRAAHERGALTLADLYRVLLRHEFSPRPLAVRNWGDYLGAQAAQGRAHVAVAGGHHFVVATPRPHGVRIDDPARGIIDIANDTCAALLDPAVVRIDAEPRGLRFRALRPAMVRSELLDIHSAATASATRIRSRRAHERAPAPVVDPPNDVDRIVVRRSIRLLAALSITAVATCIARKRAVPVGALVAMTGVITYAYNGSVRDARAVRYQKRVVRACSAGRDRTAEQLILRDLDTTRRRSTRFRVLVSAAATAAATPRTDHPMLLVVIASAVATTVAEVVATIDTLRRSHVALAHRKDHP